MNPYWLTVHILVWTSFTWFTWFVCIYSINFGALAQIRSSMVAVMVVILNKFTSSFYYYCYYYYLRINSLQYSILNSQTLFDDIGDDDNIVFMTSMMMPSVLLPSTMNDWWSFSFFSHSLSLILIENNTRWHIHTHTIEHISTRLESFDRFLIIIIISCLILNTQLHIMYKYKRTKLSSHYHHHQHHQLPPQTAAVNWELIVTTTKLQVYFLY